MSCLIVPIALVFPQVQRDQHEDGARSYTRIYPPKLVTYSSNDAEKNLHALQMIGQALSVVDTLTELGMGGSEVIKRIDAVTPNRAGAIDAIQMKWKQCSTATPNREDTGCFVSIILVIS